MSSDNWCILAKDADFCLPHSARALEGAYEAQPFLEVVDNFRGPALFEISMLSYRVKTITTNEAHSGCVQTTYFCESLLYYFIKLHHKNSLLFSQFLFCDLNHKAKQELILCIDNAKVQLKVAL